MAGGDYDRTGKVGSSDIGTILGLNTYKSPLQLWMERTGKIADDFEGNPYTDAGTLMEPFIANRFSDFYGLEISDAFGKMHTHHTHTFATCTPDYYVNDTDFTATAILECKYVVRDIKDEWEDQSAPLKYIAQVQWQMGILEIDAAYICAMIGGDPFKIPAPLFYRDQEWFEQALEAAQNFLLMCERDIPPAPGPNDSKLIDILQSQIKRKKNYQKRISSEHELKAMRLIAEHHQISKKLASINKLKKELDDKKRQVSNELRLLSPADAEVAYLPDGQHIKITVVEMEERVNPGYSFTKISVPTKPIKLNFAA